MSVLVRGNQSVSSSGRLIPLKEPTVPSAQVVLWSPQQVWPLTVRRSLIPTDNGTTIPWSCPQSSCYTE